MLNEIFNSIVRANQSHNKPVAVVVTEKTRMIILRDVTPSNFYMRPRITEEKHEEMLFGLPLKVDDNLKKEYEIQT